MKVKQISVFLENTTGRLAEVTKTIAEAGINLRAISIADTADFGILRMIVDKPDRAMKVLKESEFTAKLTDVIGIVLNDKPGGLLTVMEIFNRDGVNIEYLYSSLIKEDESVVIIFKVEDIEHGLGIVEKAGLEAIASF
ncbi:MAG: ACT domain-containing protein [Spirochaetales bacterium]|nr:ACT domain-containing protein [Spirochaetales bacterium]